MAEKKNAMQVVHRGQNLPFVEYDDGSIGWGVPQVYYDLKDSWNQFTNAAEAARGIPHTPEESFPRQQDAILAGAAMAGSGLGHLGLRGRVAGSVAGAERAEASGLKPPSNYYELYHGTAAPEQFSEFSLRNVRNKHEPGVFFTDKPDVASNYARASADDSFADGRVFRAYLPKDDVMDYEMGKARGVDPIMDARGDALNLDKKAIRFIGPKGESTYMVLSPSALRYQDQIAQGLASNAVQRAEASSGLPSHSAGTGSTPVRAYHSTYADFDRFDKAKSEEFGVHFGTPDQVNSRLVEKGGLEKRDGFENARVLPVDLQIKNPIDVRDLANWSSQDLAGQLMQKGVRFTRDEIAALDRANRRTGNTIIENALERAGYDALRYQNLSEGPGSSYAVWKPGTVKSPFTGETLFSNPKEAAPVGVLATGAGDEAARMARARALGFDPDTTWYHGTDKAFDEFSLERAGQGASGAGYDAVPAVWFQDDPHRASGFAEGGGNTVRDGANVVPAYLRGAGDFDVWDMGHASIVNRREAINQALREAQEAGAPGVVFQNLIDTRAPFAAGASKGANVAAIFDPKNIRSKFAAFQDPDSANLLASNPPDVSPAGLLATGQDAQPMQDFDTALAQLQGIIVDLDGDGVPDAQIPQSLVPQMPSNAMQAGPAGLQAPQPNAMAAFPEMVANNPRGWGNAPPGRVWQRDPGMVTGEARNTSRPEEYTAPIAEMTPPVIPGMGAVIQAAPRVAGLVAGGMGLAAMTGTEGEGTESPAQNLYKQQAALSQRLEAARAKADAEGASGRGPRWQALDAEARNLKLELDSVNAMLKEETTRNSPERQQDIAKRAADLAAEEQKRIAATPFRERYPNAAGALPMAGLAIAGAIPGAIGAKKAVGSFFPGSYAGRVRAGIRGAEAAVDAGDAAAMDISRRYLDNLVAAQPTMKSNAMEAGMAGAAGGGLAAEANMFPDQYDAFNLPPGKEQEEARARALNPVNYAERAAIGTLTGLSGYKIGSKFPERKPDIPRANAMSSYIRDNPVSSTPPGQAAKVVTRVKGDDGVVRFHDEAGKFTSAPNAKK